jgi:hypothetical protein
MLLTHATVHTIQQVNDVQVAADCTDSNNGHCILPLAEMTIIKSNQ